MIMIPESFPYYMHLTNTRFAMVKQVIHITIFRSTFEL